MPQSRAVLERQLKLAEQDLDRRVQEVKQINQDPEACANDPLWRRASAVCTSLRRRLNAVAAVEANNAEVTRRKLEPKPEKAAEPAAEKKPKKSDGEKAKSEKSEKPEKPKAEKGDKPEKAKGEKAKAAK
jgi:hypothetical protein